MATTRQSKGARKGPAEPTVSRNSPSRTPAWGTGARASPTFSSANAPSRQQQQQPPAPPPTTTPAPQPNFPPLAQTQAPQANGARSDSTPPRDRVLQALSGLTGTTITLLTKSAQRYEGVIGSISIEGHTTGLTLKDVKEITNPGAPLKDFLFIPAANIDSYSSGPADAKPTNGDSFRTDTDISQKKSAPGRERDLQAWVSIDDPHPAAADDDTFGPSNGSTSWDQFSVNEQLFGVKASFDEDLYTTKLDRSAPDFKERERKAQKIANEIIGAVTSNPHVAEERGMVVDDSGANEEDKYGAVVRGQNAYVPPGARKGGPLPPSQPSPTAGETLAKADAIPNVSINGPDGSSVPPAQTPVVKTTASAPTAAAAATAVATSPPADAVPAFRQFVTNEKQRLTQKRQALVKSDMDKRMAELVKFSQSFKLNKPMPDDLVPILAKDEERQRQIKEKADKDAASGLARAIGPSTPATASRGLAVGGAKMVERKPVSQALAGKGGAAGTPSPSGAAAVPAGGAAAQKTLSAANAAASSSSGATSGPATKPSVKVVSTASPSTGTKKISMVIQTIPPFRGGKAKSSASTSASTTPQASGTGANGTPVGNASANTSKNGTNQATTQRVTALSPAAAAPSPTSPNTAAANRLNIGASPFRPNPKANAFNPVTATPKNGPGGPGPNQTVPTASPKVKADSAPGTPNPFFGTRLIKKSTPVHVKDDFNPFKHNKVVDASQVAALWPYSGKRYMQMFPQPQHPPAQHSAHMQPPVPAPMPPPTYDEDSGPPAGAQQPHRGYMYYPPYGYPPQHMMPGMPPPGPPGAYMPSPYMQHMPYPPGMPPPNAMYSPAMGQMPPYMQPPPPGAYPPPPNPNGAGPRPSMPPTPIPTHAHPYYHQSPQLQHAYPMMMPPPPNIPPHAYEGGPAPPVPMGGHA